MSMEGIEQNPVVYDLMSEMAFKQSKIDVKVILLNPIVPWKIAYVVKLLVT